MASRRKRYKSAGKSRQVAIAPEEPLSDIWYTNKELWKLLDISPSTAKRWRENGSLKASKNLGGKLGKVYFNHTHVQDLLKGGLKTIVAWLTLLVHVFDGWDMVIMG
ncbi:MAG TPA: helix-turn-helix domain-containing protein [Hanamia sp.]